MVILMVNPGPKTGSLFSQVFLEMIRFVYLNTCHVDQGNVKAADSVGMVDFWCGK